MKENKVFNSYRFETIETCTIQGLKPIEAQALMHKHPVSIALSNRVLEKKDREASKQKRSRSEYVELHFETLFFAKELENRTLLVGQFTVYLLGRANVQ